MAEKIPSRFDAQKVRRLGAVNNPRRRVEVEFSAEGERPHVVTLPVEVAAALGRLLCDLAEGTPFLVTPKKSKKDETGVK